MISKKSNLIVLMPPKTASNSLRVLFEQSGIIFFNDSTITNYPQIHLKLGEIINLYNISDLKKFKIIQIVRNPYERFVSSFFFQKKITPHYFTPNYMKYNLEEFSEHLVKSKKNENFIESFYGDSSFVNFSISNGISWGGSRLYDTQLSWNDLGEEVSYFKLEEVSKSTESLSYFLKINLPTLPKINSQDLSANYTSLITPKVKEIILDLFNEDFETFGYEK